MTREELTLKAIAAYNGNLYNGMTKALEAVVEMVLEEAAKVADGIKATVYDDDLIEVGRLQACKEIAAAIRALKEGE